MNLARIDNRREHNWVHGTFGRGKPWIGLNDIRRERVFRNADGCPRRFVAWATNEPNNQSNEDCAQLWTLKGWNDNRCTRKFRFLCKKSNRRVRQRCGRLIITCNYKLYNAQLLILKHLQYM